MIQFAQTAGWLLFLATLMALVSKAVGALVVHIWKQGAEGKSVSEHQALATLTRSVKQSILFVAMRKLPAFCSTVSFGLLWLATDVGFYAALGFSSLTFFVSGIITPAVLSRLTSLTGSIQSSIRSKDL